MRGWPAPAAVIPLLILSLQFLPACGSSDAGGGRPEPTARVVLPRFPFWSNQALTIDEARIADFASRECRSADGDLSSADFFLGTLPLGSIDRLCEGAAGADTTEALLGNLYLSGYFGGIWLRDALSEPERLDGGPATQTPVLDRIVFDAIVTDTARRLYVAREGTDEEVLSTAHRAVPLLLTLFGYNRGYIEVALEHPPEGIVPPVDVLVCRDFLDCENPAIRLSSLDRFARTLKRLREPTSPEWAEMADDVDRWGVGAVNSGREVWEMILSGSSFAGNAYEALLRLSVGYLLVTEVAVLAGMTGWAEGRSETARCGGLLQAGLMVWSESYFLGLASTSPRGTFPEVACSSP